ncbi:MAG: hypothetical protein HPY81_07490 [Firmicutes bacterium]|nr:hypothetical protein [Bacillota bacterium]
MWYRAKRDCVTKEVLPIRRFGNVTMGSYVPRVLVRPPGADTDAEYRGLDLTAMDWMVEIGSTTAYIGEKPVTLGVPAKIVTGQE